MYLLVRRLFGFAAVLVALEGIVMELASLYLRAEHILIFGISLLVLGLLHLRAGHVADKAS